MVIGGAPPGEGRRRARGWRVRGSGDGRPGCADRAADPVGPSGPRSWGRPAKWPRLGPTAGSLSGTRRLSIPAGRRPTSCCGRIRTSASGSCIVEAGPRRVDATALPAVTPRLLQGPRHRPGHDPGRRGGRGSAGPRRTQRRLAGDVGLPPGRGRARPRPGSASEAVAGRVGPPGAGRPGHPGARARRPRARSTPCSRPRRREPPGHEAGAGARPAVLVPSSCSA